MSTPQVTGGGVQQQRKNDVKAEDSEGADCWEDLERSLSTPCVVATVAGMLLFTVLAALAFNQVGRPLPVGVFTGRAQKGRLPPNTLDPAKAVQVNPEQSVASWVKPTFLPDVLEVDDAQLISGELYGAGRAQLHRVDTLKEFQSDLLRTHGKMMAVKSTGLHDIGPFLAHINGPTYTNARGATGQEVPTVTRLAYDPEGVLLMVFATQSGNLYGTRIRTGLNPGASEGWERGSQWSDPLPIVEQRSGNIHCRVQDPVLFYDPHANAFRIVYTGYIDAKQYFLFMISSADKGGSWTWPEQLYIHPGVRSFGNVLRPTSQNYVVPIQREPNVGSGWKTVSALLSDDHAVSFREVEIQSVSEPNYVGPAMVQLRDGSFAVYLAPESSDTLRMKVSRDGGKTWGDSIRTDIPSSGIAYHSATVLRSGLVAIMFVNHFKAPGKTVKSPLSIAISLDAHGRTFAHVRDIELANGHELGGFDVKRSKMPGFDYPSLLQTPNGLLHIVYPCTRFSSAGGSHHGKVKATNFIKYVAVDEEWLTRGSSLPSRGVYQGLSDSGWRHT